MDNKGLNINLPLLSVRRFSSKSSSQKNENRNLPVKKPSIESYKTESSSSSSNPMMTSERVPFGWEHTPGRPKKEKNKQIQTIDSPVGRFFQPKKIFKAECSKSTKKETSGSLNDPGDNDNGETSFNSCSTSGVNGLGSDVKHSGLLRAEPKLRDFKLARFLPAARAVVSDVPKKIAVKDKPREVKKLVKTDAKEKDYDYDSDFAYHEHGLKSAKFCGLLPRFRSANRVHGMCVKAKLPISPANRTHASSSSSSSFREVNSEPSRSGVFKHGSWNSVSKLKSIEPANLEGSKLYNRLQKPGISADLNGPMQYNRRQGSGLSGDLSGSIQSYVSEQSNSSLKRKGISFSGPGLSGDLSGSFQSTFSEQSYSSSKRKGISFSGPRLSGDLSGSVQSAVSEQSDSSSKKKGIKFKELLTDKNNTDEVTEPESQDSITEKTVYIDTVHIAESSKENSSPSFTKPQSSFFNEPLESKTRKCKDPEAEFECFDDVKCKQKLKGYEPRFFQHLAPPPLPKSPSDSWLCRTLPSVSSKKPHALWIPIYPSLNTVVNDPKTDENDPLQSPQEQMNPMPES